MKFSFAKATMEDVPEVYGIIKSRIAWFDEKGIRQWNVTRYLERFPLSYFYKQAEEGRLYAVFEDKSIVGAMTLFEKDKYWQDDEPALYIHNFVTHPSVKGAGLLLLEKAEKIARDANKISLRLDCPADNPIINRYYEEKGFRYVGECSDGPYRGHKREKKLK